MGGGRGDATTPQGGGCESRTDRLQSAVNGVIIMFITIILYMYSFYRSEISIRYSSVGRWASPGEVARQEGTRVNAVCEQGNTTDDLFSTSSYVELCQILSLAGMAFTIQD